MDEKRQIINKVLKNNLDIKETGLMSIKNQENPEDCGFN
jgi:hypothetical protein